MEHDRGNLFKAAALLERAVSIDPDNSTIQLWYGMFNQRYGFIDKAIEHLEIAYKNDPLVGIVNGALGMAYLSAGKEASAMPLLERAEADAFFHHAAAKFNHLVYSGEFEAALAYRARFYQETSDGDELRARHLVQEAIRSGDASEVDVLVENGNEIHVLPGSWWMSTYLALDLEDLYFETLARIVAEVPYWRMSMRFFWQHGNRKYIEHPRFFAIMADAGVVELWEQRGYPDDCERATVAGGDHLDCSDRYE